MKKITKALALILVLAMVLCSCGKSRSFSDGLDQNGYFKGITAKDYFDIKNMDEIKLSQADLDDEINYLVTEAFPDQIHITDRAITEADAVNIDYVGSVDGVEFEGGSTGGQGTDVSILETNYIDGFLPQLIGHKAGDEFDINVTFPDPYEPNTDLSGKAAVFKTKVNYIIEYTPAEFNDDFVKNNLYSYFYYYYGVSLNTVEDYLDYTKQTLIEGYILNNCTLAEGKEVPESVQKAINNSTILNLKEYAERYKGVELITFLKDQYSCNSEEEYLEKNKDQLATQAKNAMLIQALSEYYGLSISDDEVKDYFKSDQEDALTFDDAVKEYGLPYLKQYLLQDKVISHVTSMANFE